MRGSCCTEGCPAPAWLRSIAALRYPVNQSILTAMDVPLAFPDFLMSVDWNLVVFDEAAKTQKADTCREGPIRLIPARDPPTLLSLPHQSQHRQQA